MRICPVAVKLDYVGVLQLRQVLKHLLNFLLLRLEVLPLRELHLVPNDLDPLLCVHGQVGAVDAGHIPLLHLENTNIKELERKAGSPTERSPSQDRRLRPISHQPGPIKLGQVSRNKFFGRVDHGHTNGTGDPISGKWNDPAATPRVSLARGVAPQVGHIARHSHADSDSTAQHVSRVRPAARSILTIQTTTRHCTSTAQRVGDVTRRGTAVRQ